MELHEPPWSSMELHGGLHGVPDNVGGPQRALGPEGGGQAVCPTPQFVFATACSHAVEQCERRCDGGVLPRVGVLVALRF